MKKSVLMVDVRLHQKNHKVCDVDHKTFEVMKIVMWQHGLGSTSNGLFVRILAWDQWHYNRLFHYARAVILKLHKQELKECSLKANGKLITVNIKSLHLLVSFVMCLTPLSIANEAYNVWQVKNHHLPQ